MATGPYNIILPQVLAKLKSAATASAQIAGATVGGKIVEDTPVDTGHARANWHVLINSDDPRVTDDVDPDGSATKARIEADARRLKLGDTLSIANSVSYIEILEHGGSDQAPNGMMNRNRSLVPAVFEREMKKALK